MNVRKISVAPLEPQSAIIPKNSTITKKVQKTSFEPKVSSSDLENIRDSVLPAKPIPKSQNQEQKKDIINPIKQQSTNHENQPITPQPSPLPPQNPKARIVKVVQNEGTTEQYESDLEVGTMFRRVDGHVEETLHEEAFILKTMAITTAVFFSSACGVLLILIGFAESEAFQNIEPNVGVVCVGFFLQLPVGYWIYRKIYPSKEEIEAKRRIRKNRNYRSKALQKDDIRYIEDPNDQDREYFENEKKAMRNKSLYEEHFKKKNPLGYPTLGVTRKRWDDS